MSDIEKRLDRLERMMRLLLSDKVASDRELAGQYGDPQVRKDPKDWRGPSMEGRRFSECPADFLLALAEISDWKAEKDLEKNTEESLKYAKYAKRDARLARGWAIKGGERAVRAPEPEPEPAYPMAGGVDEDIPF
jgi:hypothetical protein